MLHITTLPKTPNNIELFLLSHSDSTHHLLLCATEPDSITLSVVRVLYLQGVSWLLVMF